METTTALITNDAIVLGVLMVLLGAVFWTAGRPGGFWNRFYKVVPSLLLCYFLPSLLSTFGIIDPDASRLYYVASRYLLPASLVLLTLSVDLPGIARLGPKAVAMFLTGTVGVVLGGPVTVLLFHYINPDLVGGAGPDAVWRGLATVAGSWIGGGANQAAMYEVFGASADLYSVMIAVDVIVANVWMAVLLWAAGRHEAIDARNGADASAVTELRDRVSAFHKKIARIPSLADTMLILAVGFAVTGASHLLADRIAPYLGQFDLLAKLSLGSGFFWLIVLATTGGVLLSFSRARELEGVGASRIGSVFIYVLVATIGMKMDLRAIFEHPGLFLVGLVWILFHAGLLITVAWFIKAPVFMMAVGSQANIGGAASAPIVASAFHPSLAPVGVLLAVLGYALGTYAAWICANLMMMVAP